MSGTTSLFTDIVGSTEKAVELGDGGWATLLEHHHSIVRAAIDNFQGKEMDTSGDGFFAIFDRPADAIAAAGSFQAPLRELGLSVRSGVHVGDCWVADNKCTGLAVHVGARIAALARPGEILLSEAAKDAAGAGYWFADRGEVRLRGVPGRWHIFAVTPTPSPLGPRGAKEEEPEVGLEPTAA